MWPNSWKNVSTSVCRSSDGWLAEGEPWLQQSIVGSKFSGSYRWLHQAKGTVIPTINGTPYVTAEITLRLHEEDPFRHGIR